MGRQKDYKDDKERTAIEDLAKEHAVTGGILVTKKTVKMVT